MSQLSAPIEYIVDHILPNYSEDELAGMIAALAQYFARWETVARTNETGRTTRLASHGDGPALSPLVAMLPD